MKILWVEFTQNYTFFLEIPLGPHWFKKKKSAVDEEKKERTEWGEINNGDEERGWDEEV